MTCGWIRALTWQLLQGLCQGTARAWSLLQLEPAVSAAVPMQLQVCETAWKGLHVSGRYA